MTHASIFHAGSYSITIGSHCGPCSSALVNALEQRQECKVSHTAEEHITWAGPITWLSHTEGDSPLDAWETRGLNNLHEDVFLSQMKLFSGDVTFCFFCAFNTFLQGLYKGNKGFHAYEFNNYNPPLMLEAGLWLFASYTDSLWANLWVTLLLNPHSSFLRKPSGVPEQSINASDHHA